MYELGDFQIDAFILLSRDEEGTFQLRLRRIFLIFFTSISFTTLYSQIGSSSRVLEGFFIG